MNCEKGVMMSNLLRAIGKRKNACYALLLTAGILLTVLFFRRRLVGEGNLFVVGDLLSEFIPFIRCFFRSLSGKESFLYSFSLGLGSQSFPVYVTCCLSPFNIFYLLIADVNLASILVVVSKLAFAAYAFEQFLEKKLKITGIINISISVSYALCGYSIAYMQNIIFMDAVYMLPIIIGALLDFVSAGKWIKLACSYAYLFVVCYYGGYVCGVFSFLLFILILTIPGNEDEWKLFDKNKNAVVRGYIKAVVIALLLSAVTWFPTAQFLLSHLTDDASAFQGMKCNIWDLLQNSLIGMYQSNEGEIPYLYSGLFCIVILPLFFLGKSTGKKNKAISAILLIFLVLCSLCKPFYMLIHMFDAPDSCGHRYAYLYSFMLCAMASYTWKNYDEKKKKWASIIVVIVITVAMVINNIVYKKELSLIVLGINVAIVFLYVVLLSIKNKKIKVPVIAISILFEVCINTYLVVQEPSESILEEYEIYQSIDDVDFDELESGDIYRIKTTMSPILNSPAFYGYMGIGYFNSIENSNVRKTMGKLGYGVSPRVLLDYGGTIPVEMLLGVKKNLYTVRYEDNSLGQMILDTEYSLPIAYMVDNDICSLSLESDLAVKNINALFSAMMGDDEEIMGVETEDYTTELDNMTVDFCDGEYRTSLVDFSKVGTINYTSSLNHEDVYIQFGQKVSKIKGNSPIIVSGGIDGYIPVTNSYLALSHMIKLERNDEGKYYASIYTDPENCDGIGEYTEMAFSYINWNRLDRIYESLMRCSADNLKRDKNVIQFDIEASECKNIVFVSVPYEDGWKVLVDGNKAEVIPLVDKTFCGVALTPGQHHVVMTYSNIYNWIGLEISIIGILIMGLFLYFEKRHPFQYNDEVQTNQE